MTEDDVLKVLFGAAVGALSTIGIFLLMKWYEHRKMRRAHEEALRLVLHALLMIEKDVAPRYQTIDYRIEIADLLVGIQNSILSYLPSVPTTEREQARRLCSNSSASSAYSGTPLLKTSPTGADCSSNTAARPWTICLAWPTVAKRNAWRQKQPSRILDAATTSQILTDPSIVCAL